MLKIALSTIAVLSLAFSAAPAMAASKKVDAAKSKVVWTGAKVIGSTHTGNVKVKSGAVQYKGKDPVSAKVVIDMKSITNADVKDPKWNKKLVTHLHSGDFFDTAKHPTATLDINKITKVNDQFYALFGNLVIKGIKQPVKLKAEVAGNMVKTKFTFDRTKFNIKYGSGSFFTDLGDKMISDEVEVATELALMGKADRS